MKRSLVGLLCAAALAMVSGCGEREASEPAAPSEPATHVVSPRHEEVTLATTTSIPTTTPTAPRVAPAEPTVVAPRVSHRAGELTLRRLIVSTDVADHEPVGANDVIDADEERVYAFLDVANPGDEETLVVTFTSDDGERVVGHVEVSVPAHASRWRTWAFTRHLSPGDWHAEVHTESGALVGTHAFEVR